MKTSLPNPFDPAPREFVLDEEKFLRDIGVQPMPVFLSQPSEEYLTDILELAKPNSSRNSAR